MQCNVIHISIYTTRHFNLCIFIIRLTYTYTTYYYTGLFSIIVIYIPKSQQIKHSFAVWGDYVCCISKKFNGIHILISFITFPKHVPKTETSKHLNSNRVTPAKTSDPERKVDRRRLITGRENENRRSKCGA